MTESFKEPHMPFTLPPLPFGRLTLAPHMSAETIDWHHGKHHQAYVDKTNALASEAGLDAQPLVDLIRRANLVTLATIAILSILATFVRSPLEEPANPLVTPNPAKAPWYFLWLQEIVTDTTVKIGSFTINGAFVGGVVLPGLLVTGLILWPWLDRSPKEATGVWFANTRRKQNLVFILLCMTRCSTAPSWAATLPAAFTST